VGRYKLIGSKKLAQTHLFFSIVKITSDMVFKERWGKQVLDINELHDKMLEFEVLFSHLKLRELHT